MSSSAHIRVHHIGARGVTQALPPLPAFDAEFVNVLYDADTACVDEIRRLNDGRRAEVLVFPYCLGAEAGDRDFYHLQSPYASSLLPPNPDAIDCYFPFVDMDYWLREGFALRSVERLAVHRLDYLLADGRVPVPPDVLSLDTQGSELDILRGAERALAGAVGVITEVEFLPMYAGQPLYGEVARQLVTCGFMFAQFGKTSDVAFARLPLGARGRRFAATCDATFLRDPRSVVSQGDRSPAEKKLILRKLAFVSIALGFLEHARFALEVEARDPAVRDADLPADTAWLRFVAEFDALVRAGDGVYPPTYSEKRRRVFGDGAEAAPSDDPVWPPRDDVCAPIAARAADITDRSDRLAGLLAAHGLNDVAAAVRQQTQADLDRFRAPGATFPVQWGLGVQEAYDLATVLRNAGETDRAEALYHRVLAAVPGHAECQFQLGWLAVGRDDLERALDWFFKAFMLTPENPNYRDRVIRTCAELGRRQTGSGGAADPRSCQAVRARYREFVERAFTSRGLRPDDRVTVVRPTMLIQETVALADEWLAAVA